MSVFNLDNNTYYSLKFDQKTVKLHLSFIHYSTLLL